MSILDRATTDLSSSVVNSPPVDPAIAPLPPEQDATAAAILAAAMEGGTVADAATALAAVRAEPETEFFGRVIDGELVAAYGLRAVGMAREVLLLAVAPDHRRQGHGRACLQDALRRAGKRPLVAETDDDALAFYRAVGFKLVGKRRHPSGTLRYRLGWHAPTPSRPGDRAPLRVLPSPLRGCGVGGEGVSPNTPK